MPVRVRVRSTHFLGILLGAGIVALRSAEPSPVIKFSVPPPPPPVSAPAVADDGVAPTPEAGAGGERAGAGGREAPPPPETLRSAESVFELQVELHRRGFSCGSIDGVMGAQTASALKAWQRTTGIRETGVLDEATRAALPLTAAAWKEHVLTAEELDALHPMPDTWLGKSQADALAYATPLELVAERYRASPKFLQQINPEIDWADVKAGARIQVPAIERVKLNRSAARILIWLEARELEVVDADGVLLAHFPVSIARMAEKRPVGELHVKVVAPDPNYTFDPAVFPESAEAQELGRKLILPPGPNNPVGVAWIGLDRPGYGIHGTPEPEKVGRTESHGCFRLANWDATALLGVVRVGMPVIVEQ